MDLQNQRLISQIRVLSSGETSYFELFWRNKPLNTLKYLYNNKFKLEDFSLLTKRDYQHQDEATIWKQKMRLINRQRNKKSWQSCQCQDSIDSIASNCLIYSHPLKLLTLPGFLS